MVEVLGEGNEAGREVTTMLTTTRMLIKQRRKVKWKSIWKHVPFYSHFCNTFVAITMISSVLQTCVVNLILLVMLVSVRPHVSKHEAYESRIGPTIDKTPACSTLLENTSAVFFCSFVAILLGLPATGWKPFQLYHRQHDSKELCQVKRSPYLTLCELIVIVEIPFLIACLVMFVLQLNVHMRSVGHCAAYLSNSYMLLIVVERLLVFYAYGLCWYQVILFNRMRDHALFQRGIFPACRTFVMKCPDAALTSRGKRIARIKQALYTAARTNDIPAVQRSIQEAIEVDGTDFASRWYVCRRMHGGAFLFLFFLPSSLSCVFQLFTRSARNPLHVACAKANIQVVRVLLDSGWDVNSLDKVLWTSLAFSELYEKMFGLLYFLRNIHYAYRAASELGQASWLVCTLLSPLHVACAVGHPDLVSMLIESGADVNQCAISTNRKEATPPIYYARCSDCVAVLIQARANHLYVPGRGFYLTPLQVAVLDDRREVAATIQKWGGDIALTPLHRACASGNIKAVLTLLMHGTNPNVLGEHSRGIFLRTPMHWAAMRGHVAAVQLLAQFGADLDARDAAGRTPLTWACYHNHTIVVTYLLNDVDGADATVRDNSGRTIAIVAAEVDGIDASIFKALSRAGLDINATQGNGDTALHVAIQHGHRGTAVALLRAGADMMATNHAGLRAIDCTCASDLQYAIKKEAGNRDVMISYSHARTAFANKVRACLEHNHITTWFDHVHPSGIGGGAEWREEIARGISNASVLLCILSPEYPKSQWCMKELALAKQYGKPVVAILCANGDGNGSLFEWTDELQVYLMSRQIIDFTASIVAAATCTGELQYDQERFDNQMRLLLDGLRDEIEIRRVNASAALMRLQQAQYACSDNTTFLASSNFYSSASTRSGSQFVFVAHGDCHTAFARQLKASLRVSGVSCYLDSASGYASPEERMRAAKDAILYCSAFIVVLSAVSSSTALLSDQLSFAEDRGKPIVPVLYSAPALSLGKQYTLSVNRVIHFADGIGYSDSFDLLLASLSENMAPLRELEPEPELVGQGKR